MFMIGLKVSIGFALGLWLSTAALILITAASGQHVFTNEGQIAFETDRDGNWEIYTLDVRTGLVFNLSRNDAADHAPSWSPDGSRLAFHSNRGGETDIYIMNADGNQLRRLTFTGSSWRPRWSPDGRQIMYTQGFNEIYIMGEDGSRARYVTGGFGPEWSPDGQLIAYYVNQDGSLNSDIHISDTNGSNRRNVTNNPANDWAPNWLPDGRSFAFTSSRDGRAQVYVASIACVLEAQSPDICAQPLHLTSAITRTPNWSPDGRRIAFDSIRHWQSQLYIMNADGSALRLLTAVRANDQFPVWSP